MSLLNNPAAKKLVAAGVITSVFGMAAFSAAFQTEDKERHVVMRFGEYSRTSEPGLNFKIPFLETKKRYPIDVQDIVIGPKNVASKGNQTLEDVVVKYQYRLPADNIEWVHKNAPEYHARAATLGAKVSNEVLGNVNTITLAESRQAISNKMQAEFQQLLDNSGINLSVTAASLENFEWDSTFRDSIKKNAEVKNEIVRLEAEEKREEVNARKKVIVANGEADMKRAAASGEADKRRTEAEGDRDARKAQADGMAYQLETEGNARATAFSVEIQAFGDAAAYVDYTKAKAWDGQLPTIVSGGGDGMFIDLRSGDATAAAAAARLPAPGMK